jgi:hypothetical protein
MVAAGARPLTLMPTAAGLAKTRTTTTPDTSGLGPVRIGLDRI